MREHSGKKTPIWSSLINYYSICVPSVVTELSRTLWNLHQRIGGTKNETYKSFYDLPAFWVDACNHIDDEMARIDRAKKGKLTQMEQELVKSLGK